jgi:DNA-binding response OmpR family regulator
VNQAKEILLIDDSPETGITVKLALGNRFRVTQVSKETEVHDELFNRRYDLILLDVMLPDFDGFQMFTQLRHDDRTRNIPIIFLTGKNTTADEAMGLNLGADDYVVKPFEALKLRARVESRLNKNDEKRELQDWIRGGDIKLSVSSQKVVICEGEQETELALTRHEFQILNHLLRHEEQVVTREQLLSAVWAEKGIEVMDRVVDRHVSSLRKKLGTKATSIETTPGVGYCFRSIATAKKKAA